jgi:RHS repeat-associated protein
MDNLTIYVSPCLVFNETGYSKHCGVYAERSRSTGAERVSSRIGGGMLQAPLDPLSSPLEHLSEQENWEAIANDLLTMLKRGITCTEFDVDRASMESQLFSIGHSATINDPEENWYIYHSDHLGSSSFLTDASGDPTQHLQYMPFGETFIEQRSVTSFYTPYTFSAKERDPETGYSYFGARYYDADISVWLSVDPMADKGAWISPYAYAFHNPKAFIDPNGEWPYPASIQTAGPIYRMIWNTRLWIKNNVMNKSGPIKVRTMEGKKDLYNPVRNNNKSNRHCCPIRENFANFDKGPTNSVNSTSLQSDPTSSSIYVNSGKTSSKYPFTGIARDKNGQPTPIPILEEFPDGSVSFRAEFRSTHGLSRKAQPNLNSAGDVTVERTGQVVFKKPSGLEIGDAIEDHGGQTIITRNQGAKQIDVTQQVLNTLP